MSIDRKFHKILFISLLSILALDFICFYAVPDLERHYYFVIGVMKPLLWGGTILLATICTLFLFNIKVFQLWFKYIASWYVPLTLVLVISINPYSSNILSFDRESVALQMMILLWGVTSIFAIGYTVITRLRNK